MIIKMLKKQKKQEISYELTGKTVRTKYNNFIYTICGIAWDKDPMHKFQIETDTEIVQFTYNEYYKKRYNEGITDYTQPLVEVRPYGHSVYLMPELCYINILDEKDTRELKMEIKEL